MSELLPWQSKSLSRLQARIEGGALSHALLIEGRDARSAEMFSGMLTKTLVCQQEVIGGCGECRSCELGLAETNPDRWAIKREDEAQIKVESIRELIEWSQKTTQIGRVKVAVIEGCERMNRNAQNALLKLLEEPTRETYLILVTADPHRLLATVRSRCERVRLGQPSDEEALNWVKRRLGDSDHHLASEALAFAHGEPLAAIEAISNGLAERLVEIDAALCAWFESEISSLELGRKAMDLAEPKDIYTLLALRLRESVRTEVRPAHEVKASSGIASQLQGKSSWQCRLEGLALVENAWSQSKTMTGLNQALHLEATLINLERVLS